MGGTSDYATIIGMFRENKTGNMVLVGTNNLRIEQDLLYMDLGTIETSKIKIDQKGILTSVPEGATSIIVSLPLTEPDTSYGVLVTPWWLTTYRISSKTTTSFTVEFGTAAPTGGSYIDWFLFR